MSKSNERLQHGLAAFIPAMAMPHCLREFEHTPVSVRLTKGRKSKWGDYRIRPDRPPEITVNGDLPAAFLLMTLMHELAHHRVYLRYGLRSVAPHGKEWKQQFSQLMAPLLNNEAVFGSELTPLVRAHMRNPKANAAADQRLYRIYLNAVTSDAVLLESLPQGVEFIFRTRRFKISHRSRKRIACECVMSNRMYLFRPVTPVLALGD